MGNLDSLRDWGHARDYVHMQWLMLQQNEARDYVIASGQQISVRDFIQRSALRLGITIQFENSGLDERGIVAAIDYDVVTPRIGLNLGDVIVAVGERYFRPAEVESLLGDASRARDELGWKPKTSLDEMIDEMIANDLQEAQKRRLLADSGYQLSQPSD